MPDNKELLYTNLKEKGLYRKSFNEFKTQFSSLEKTDKLYQELAKKGLYSKSASSFTNQFFPELNKENTLRNVYKDLGLESAGVSFDKFSVKMMSDAKARKLVYKDLDLENAGVTYDKFESTLNIKKKKLTVEEFATKIKAKYPQYKEVDNAELIDRIANKYPEYKDVINTEVTSEKGKKLYEALKNDSKYKGIGKDYESFKNYFSDENNGKKLFTQLNSDPKYKGLGSDYETFANGFGLLKKYELSSKITTITSKVSTPVLNKTQQNATIDNNLYKYGLVAFLILGLVITIIKYRKNIIRIVQISYLTLKKNIFKIAIVLAFLISILIITNPSREDFASNQHWKGDLYLGREKNYFIFSIYSNKFYNKRYIGILGNFYEIK
jgi:hypothetical protein